MLKLILGTDWTRNTDAMFRMISQDVANKLDGRIVIVPESISHETERKLCTYASNSASRYAEVLPFSRLCGRLQEKNVCEECLCMDNGGRLVVMASAAIQLHSKLKAYASVETRPEFLMDLIDGLDEFKRCCITADDLMDASRVTEGSLAQKLEELSLLLEAYDSICHRGLRDPRDQLTWLLEQMEASDFAEDHVFYLNGFIDFTGQQLAIVRHLIESSALVVVALNCDKPASENPAFEKAGETASILLRIAQQAGVETDVLEVEADQDLLAQVREKLLAGSLLCYKELSSTVRVFRTDSVAQECDAAANTVLEYIRNGDRYRDIQIVCSDIGTYRHALQMSFRRRGIPIYISGTENILDMPIINTVISALDSATCGFEQKNMFRYLRSYLSPLSMEECDSVENYAYLWGIRGASWKRDWTKHPDGLGKEFNRLSTNKLANLNCARERAMLPLIRLEERFLKAVTLKEQVLAIYYFLEDIQLANRLEHMAKTAEDNGDIADIQVFNQLWEILVSALEQLHDVLGHTTWDTENFAKLLKLLLSQYSVGTIPPVLDSVTAGSVAAIRCHSGKHLLVLGALEGSFPCYGTSGGVLNEQERGQLRRLGVPVMGGAMDSLQSELGDIYNVICGARETVQVSCPAGQPSYVYRRLLTMVGSENPVDITLGAAEANPMDAGALLVRKGCTMDAQKLGIEDVFSNMLQSSQHTLGKISNNGIAQLYGKELRLSASKIDKVAECRLAYFLKYGARVQERKEATIDPAQFGTFVHYVLENTARRVKENGGFSKVSLEGILGIADEVAKKYIAEQFEELDSERLNYLFNRNALELSMIIKDLWEELQESAFEPFDFELKFGGNGTMDCVRFAGKNMKAQLEGYVDRVDTWKNGEQNYFRVIDYKTGKKSFDYCDVYNGIGLQMLLYMFALADNGSKLLGDHPMPAGVQYFPARAPYVSTEGNISDENLESLRMSELKRKGLVLKDEAVLSAMEPGDKPVRTNYTRRKDGTLAGDLADREQMKLLKSYVFCLLGRIVDDIASGCVDPNPYTRGNEQNACKYCPYGPICHPVYVEGRRDYKAMNAQWFWESVEKEVNDRG